jgi:hypothetical protein
MIGIASSEDGKSKRDTMDTVLIIGRSGSMGYGLFDRKEENQEASRKSKMKMQLKQKRNFGIF